MTLQEQYNSIKGGKGNKAQFLKQARSLFPQYFNQYTDFDTAANVLKSKQIISEAAGGVVAKGYSVYDWKKILGEEVKAMEKKCESCGMKYAGEDCDCDSEKEAGYSKSDMKMKKATNLSSASKQAFAAKALAEGFPQEYIDAMLGETVVASNDLAEIKNVMASELNSNVKKAAVSSMIKVATLTDSDYSRLVDYWKNELGYGDQEWIDALFTKKYDK